LGEAGGSTREARSNDVPCVFEFNYDPFEVLDASADTRIQEYLVAHEKFEAIWRDEVSFLFAPTGGGKSAFRARLADACRAGEDGRKVFPIVYMLPESVVLAPEPQRLSAHLRAIAQAAAFELFLHLAYRPYQFVSLDADTRQTVRALLEQGLPQPLDYLLEQLGPREKLDPEARLRALAQSYDPGAVWLSPPSERSLDEFRRTLEETPLPQERHEQEDPIAPWLDLLIGKLQFQAVYLLLDGVDAYPETIANPENALALLRPLLEQAEGWREQRLFVKAFLPTEMKTLVERAFPLLTSRDNVVIIEWSRDSLLELLRRRVAAATSTEHASLDMIAEPGFRGVDLRVVRAVEPLPREVLAFTRRMLYSMRQRAGASGKLSPEDFEAALRWYETDRHKKQP